MIKVVSELRITAMTCSDNNDEFYLVGFFPTAIKTQSDVSVAIAAPNATGEPRIDEKEFCYSLSALDPNFGLNCSRVL